MSSNINIPVKKKLKISHMSRNTTHGSPADIENEASMMPAGGALEKEGANKGAIIDEEGGLNVFADQHTPDQAASSTPLESAPAMITAARDNLSPARDTPQ
jgi:hypothetical protein